MAAPEGLQQALKMITIATLMKTVASQEILQDHEGVPDQEVLHHRGKHYYFAVVVMVIFFAVGAVIYEGWIVKKGITRGAEKVMKAMMLAAMMQLGKAQGSDDEDGGARRHDDSAALFFLMAAYTFLVVVEVMVLQRFAQTVQNLNMTPEERRRREILETQAELQEARERYYRVEERLSRDFEMEVRIVKRKRIHRDHLRGHNMVHLQGEEGAYVMKEVKKVIGYELVEKSGYRT